MDGNRNIILQLNDYFDNYSNISNSGKVFELYEILFNNCSYFHVFFYPNLVVHNTGKTAVDENEVEVQLSSVINSELYDLLLQVKPKLEIGESQILSVESGAYLFQNMGDLLRLEEVPLSTGRSEGLHRRRILLGQLLSDFAHGISNPMAVIQGRLELALLRTNEAKFQTLFSNLYKQALRVSSQLQSIRAISLKRPLRPIDINLSKWFKQFFDTPHREFFKVSFDVDPYFTVNVDEALFELVIENVLFHCHSLAISDVPIQIISMNNEYGHAIQIQYQGKSPSKQIIRALEGANINDSIPQRFVGYQHICIFVLLHSMNGEYTVTATSNGGAYLLKFPLNQSVDKEQKNFTLIKPIRILIIDDNVQLALALSDFLNHEGHFVQKVESAEAAFRFLDYHWDCIILDLNLPNISGAQFYSHVSENHPELIEKVVCISGVRPKNSDLSKRFLLKPFTLSQLIASIFE
jgi:CheY-like chemotaxis protein